MPHTLPQPPGNAALGISWDDWKEMSPQLTGEGTERNAKPRQLFYPDHDDGGQYINASGERRADFLAALDDAAYGELYNGIPNAPTLSFLNINTLIGLSLKNARPLQHVMRHVVVWVDPKANQVRSTRRIEINHLIDSVPFQR